jgi:peptidoglycan/LPS O-acetylase OafA/YrhL
MRERIGALDGWRGAAILLVLVDHAGELSHNPWVHKLTRCGATGVGIFFALSGFLITTLLLRERQKLGRIRVGAFYCRRVLRIVPSVVVFLGALFCLRELHILQVTRLELASSLFLFRNYIPSNWGTGWYTDHFWSLMVEEHFYLLWPLVLLTTRANLKALTAIALMVAGWRAVSLHFHLLAGPWAPGRTDIRADSLLWGCILAIIFARPELRERLKRAIPGWVMLLLVAIDVASNILHGQHDYSAYEPFILALLVVWPILYPDSILRQSLDLAPLRFVGTVSYSLYIWQQMWMLFPGAPMPFPRLQAFPLNVVMAFCCGVVCYYAVEKPFIQLGRRLILRPANQERNPPKNETKYAFAQSFSFSSDRE